MKLKNKETGKIVIAEFITDYQTDDGTEIGFRVKDTLNYYSYPSLAELIAEWEDYKPAEPLIKDEKVRKAVRAWAEANNIIYDNNDIVFDHAEHRLKWINVIIEFDSLTGLKGLEDGKTYTIAELCGEEEE